MKSFGKKAISLALAFCLLCGLIPAAVFAKDPQDAYDHKSGVYHYTSNEKGEDGSYNTEDAFIWSDGWFLSDGTSLNSHLAALSAVAAITTAGYTADDPGLSGEERFADRDRNVKEFLATMGFEDYACNGYYHTNRLPNSAGCALARKTVTDKKGDKYTLLAILPMSANYRNEWAGNFDVGAAEDDEGNGLHHGFKAGCDEILRFTKKYVKDNSITGEIKIWTAGHSRGSALANLIGAFFAAGGADYFENGLTVSPEDIYCYTFATPGTIAGKTTKARLLSVEGARGGDYAGRDTAGDAYAYPGENAVLIPDSSLFDCVHNCRPDYDLITLLPPFIGWNFTVFGKNDLPIGSKELKPAMLKHLEKADPAVYKAFTEKVTLASLLETDADGDADSYEFKKLVLDGILPGIVSDGSYSMADMLASRIDGLRVIMPDRASYVEKYQETFAAAMGIYGMAWEEFSGSFD
ncbi:MAG: hypothetical protein IJS65_01400, partial [Clostridia bacterium]|nr:hypothetical protein [Clostridia bacterium]